VVASLTMQACQHGPQRACLGIFAQSAFKCGHRAMALATFQVGLRQLGYGRALLGGAPADMRCSSQLAAVSGSPAASYRRASASMAAGSAASFATFS